MTSQNNKKISKPSQPTATKPALPASDKWAFVNHNGDTTTLNDLDKAVEALSFKMGGLAYLLGQVYLEGAHDLKPELQAALRFAADSLKDDEARLSAIWPDTISAPVFISKAAS